MLEKPCLFVPAARLVKELHGLYEETANLFSILLGYPYDKTHLIIYENL
jgi:hypothetical protein